MTLQIIRCFYDIDNHPFYPKINDLSKSIVEAKSKNSIYPRSSTDIHNRLYSLHFDKNKKIQHSDTFKPEINKNSEEIIRLMRDGNDYDANERWRTLYEFGVQKQVMRKHIEDKFKEVKEKQELNECPFRPEILPYDYITNQDPDESKDVVDRTKEWAASMECKKEVLAESHFQKQLMKEYQECTFKPRLIAEEKLKERNMTATELSSRIDVEINSKGLENFYRRMEEVHFRKRLQDDYDENYCGSGKNWTGQLTMPAIPDFHEKKELKSLDQVKCITKPVIRNGEIVRDPQIPIYRHDTYKKSEITNALRDQDREEDFDLIKNKNDTQKEELFDDRIEFND